MSAQQRLKEIIRHLEDKMFQLISEREKNERRIKWLNNLINELQIVLKQLENNNEV